MALMHLEPTMYQVVLEPPFMVRLILEKTKRFSRFDTSCDQTFPTHTHLVLKSTMILTQPMVVAR